jgi:hypothetical protein
MHIQHSSLAQPQVVLKKGPKTMANRRAPEGHTTGGGAWHRIACERTPLKRIYGAFGGI